MAQRSNQRLVLDLDDIERQLREAQLPPQPPKNDPLAELARIVGQDDPFRTLIAGEKQARRPAPTDRDALFVDPEPYGGRDGHDLHASRGDRALAYAGSRRDAEGRLLPVRIRISSRSSGVARARG